MDERPEEKNEAIEAELRRLQAQVNAGEQRWRSLCYLLLGGLAIWGLNHGVKYAWAAVANVPNNLVYQGHLTLVGGSPVTAGRRRGRRWFYYSHRRQRRGQIIRLVC